MNYIDNDLNNVENSQDNPLKTPETDDPGKSEPAVVKKTAWRVSGGTSDVEGGYITNEEPKNPIQARADLGLNQHFIGEDGKIKRNLANTLSKLEYTETPDGELLTVDGNPTGHKVEFSTVAPPPDQEQAGYQPGGGQEYKLQDPFNDVMKVENTQPLINHPTEGWSNFIQTEKEVIENAMPETTPDGNDTVEDSTETTTNTTENTSSKTEADPYSDWEC